MKQHTDPNEETTAAAGGAAVKPAEEGPRSMVRFLATLSDGELEAEGSYELHELVKRLQEVSMMTHAKAKGTLKLKLNLVADTSGTVAVFYTIDVVQPKKPTTAAVYWMTKGGNLSATDTRQLELRPRSVGEKRETREAPESAPIKEV
jgi:hypothetical protein